MPVIANSSMPTSEMAALTQCHVCSCLSHHMRAFLLPLATAGLEGAWVAPPSGFVPPSKVRASISVLVMNGPG
jgi:hypothetical protein